MLSQLTIKNFGLIDQLSVEFAGNLNILTGSTGAGKSIIIDALRFALGERLKSSQIRDKDAVCVVEAVFEITSPLLRQSEILQEYLSEEHALIINRQVLPDGRNKVRVNGFNITVNQLKDIGNLLIDFHGPHDHQMLLSEENHIRILDQLTAFGGEDSTYLELFTGYSLLQKKIDQLQSLKTSRDRDMDLLSHQIKELEQVSLNPDDYEQLCQDQVKISNAERLYENAAAVLQLLDSEEVGLSDLVRKVYSPLKHLNDIDEKTSAFTHYLDQVQENSDQLLIELKNYLDSLSFEPREAEDVNRRYDIYEDIKRKYGPDLEDARAFYDEAVQKYALLSDFEQNDADLRAELLLSERELKKAAQKLTAARQKTAARLQKTIEKELKDLGIEHVQFEARISARDFEKDGADGVVFYISPNAGENLKPLADIVSSGEAARLMLALKRALTKVDPIPVLIFDEIDAQIGGRLGTITGTKLKELSKDRQVILITHLPQIASFADRHFRITKEVVKGKTYTRLVELDKDARVAELAQMMSGQNKSGISLSHAEDMLSQAQNI